MKRSVLVLVLAFSVAAFAQVKGHGGGGSMGGPPSGAGSGMGSGMGHDMGSSMGHDTSRGAGHDVGQGPHDSSQQQPLKDAQINSGAFRMLEKKTGMSEDQLKQLYASSGAKNFGQFVSAVVVSKNLGLDTQKVLDGLKTMSLGQTLQSLGAPSDKADAEIKKAKKEIKDANKNG